MNRRDFFDNALINDIHATRYIASWYNEGGGRIRENRDSFIGWLRSIGVSEEDANFIANLGENGKLELELSAYDWLKKAKA